MSTVTRGRPAAEASSAPEEGLRDGPAGPSLTVTRDTHVSDRALISAPHLRYDSPPPLAAGCDPARGSEELTTALRRASLGGARLSRAGRSIRVVQPRAPVLHSTGPPPAALRRAWGPAVSRARCNRD